MKIQIRDKNNWMLLAETSLNGVAFVASGNVFRCNQEIRMQVIADGEAMPIAFLVTDDNQFIRAIKLDLAVSELCNGYNLLIAASHLFIP